MSQKKSGPAKKKSGPAVTTGTWIALACFIPAAVLTWNLGRTWHAQRTMVAGKQAEIAAIMARNGVLQPIYDVLANRKFQLSNKTPLTVTVPWFAVAYHDGKQVRLFDSARCREFEPVVVPTGDAKIVTLSSKQEGCNWNGSVMYYAMRLYRQVETEVSIVDRPYDYVDMYKGYDRDTFTVQ